jgi:hypothetical protein
MVFPTPARPVPVSMINRTQLKNVFWPNLFVGAAFKILDIQQYASGFKLSPAAILNQNPIFEMGSSKVKRVRFIIALKCICGAYRRI